MGAHAHVRELTCEYGVNSYLLTWTRLDTYGIGVPLVLYVWDIDNDRWEVVDNWDADAQRAFDLMWEEVDEPKSADH